MASLLQDLGRPTVIGAPNEPAHVARFSEWLGHPDRYAFVAEVDEQVIGFIDLVVVPRLNFEGPEAYVPDLIVTKSARSKGAGAALLQAVETVANDRGAFALTLDSANWRTRAHAFYRREGMADAAKHFAKVLRDVGWPPPPPGEPC